jgi:Zn-dependent protease/CBS domain-containing protein
MRFLAVFKRQFLLMHVSGIPVRADYRWFFVLLLMSAITAGSVNPLIQNTSLSLVFGLLTTIVFFGSILVHELAHAFTARLEGVQVLEIILHPFGGLARMKHEPETPRAEFRIAVAGPAASFLLAIIFAILMAITNATEARPLAPLFFLLFLFNFLVAVFNLFPGYPLDGGRVLRAYLWRSGKDLNEATILTGRCGQIIAAVLIVSGLTIAISRSDFFTGFWTILVGLFLYDSATGIIKEVNQLAHVRVDDVMQLPAAVEPETDIMHFVDHILPLNRQAVFPVAKDKQLFGILMLEDMKSIPRDDWRKTKIADVMRPVTADHFVETHTSLAEANEQMRSNGIGAVGVVDSDGKLVGFLKSGRVTKR